MVAEKEDFIIEYCMTKEVITNVGVKKGEKVSPFPTRRKRHSRD